MRYPAGEKLEIIHLVERSHLSVKRTLASLGVSRPTAYRGLWRSPMSEGTSSPKRAFIGC